MSAPRRGLWLALSVVLACSDGDVEALTTVASGAAGAAGTGGQTGDSGASSVGGDGGAGGTDGKGSSSGASGDGGSVAPLARAVIVGGDLHTCARLASGELTCWGSNEHGQLGLGDTTSRGDAPGEMGAALPVVDLGKGARVVSVAAGKDHTCALLATGRITCWGGSTASVLGLGGVTSLGSQPGQMGDALPLVDLGSGVVATDVVAGSTHTCALIEGGRVKCWGENEYGQLGLGDALARGDEPGEMGDALPFVDLGTSRHAVSLSLGDWHTCALLDDGQVRCWGGGVMGQLGATSFLINVGDKPGQMGDALATVNLGTGVQVVALFAGSTNTCAVLDGGRLKCWGWNELGQLGLGDQTLRGLQPSDMGDNLPFIDLGSGARVVSVTMSLGHACALLDDGRVKCWGGGGYLGDGTTQMRGWKKGEMGDALPFVDLGSGAHTRVLARTRIHNCVLLSDGSPRCWGSNEHGQLGLGDTTSRGIQPGQMGDALPAVELPSAVAP